jgi:TRAP-type C4-dicarboxylate transport system permease large subunit
VVSCAFMESLSGSIISNVATVGPVENSRYEKERDIALRGRRG